VGGIGVDNHYTLSLVQDLFDETLLVSEIEISHAIRYVFETQRMVLEGGAAVATAALLAKKLEVKKKNVALIYSGNNIADKTLQKVLDS
jgi:Threonine dehydratase